MAAAKKTAAKRATPTPKPAPPANTVKVKATGKGDKRVILWEVHPSHPTPNNEVFITAGTDKPIEVGLTGRVSQAIANGYLEKA